MLRRPSFTAQHGNVLLFVGIDATCLALSRHLIAGSSEDIEQMSNSSDSLFGPAYQGPERTFDFTLLFEDTILTILPASLFLVAAGARAAWLVNSPNKVVSSFGRSTKLVLLSAFAAIQLTVLLLRATNPEAATKASISAAALDFAAACVLFILSCFEHARSVTPSTVIGLYLLFSFAFDAVRVRTFYLIDGYAAQGIARLLSLSLTAKLGVLVTEAVEKRSILTEPYRELPPEQTSGIYNKTVFWWLNPLLKLGFGHNLRTDDLFTLDETLASASVHRRFTTHWTAKRTHGPNSLIYTTLDILKWQLIVSAIPRLVLAAARFTQPFLVQSTLRFITDKEDVSTGWGLAAAWVLSYLAIGVFTEAYRHLLNRCCAQVRGGLVSLLYDKTLDLSITAKDPTAAMSLMSTDIERMIDSLTLFHDIWAGLVELAVAMYLLYLNLGSACYAPAIVYALQLLGTSGLVQIISGFQKKWLAAVQKRVSFTSALLHSMRNVKLLGLSAVIKERTHALRLDEVRLCKAYRWVESIRVVLQNASSIFAPFATFLLYYLQAKSSGASLDLGTAFSILTILRIMDSPLNLLIYTSVSLASSLSCFQRIQEYLLSPSRQDNRLSLDSIYDSEEYWDSLSDDIPMRRMSVSRSPADEAISLKNCSFGWERGTEPVIKDVDFSIRVGSTTMIIGPVGCGKSTLLKGLLSETPLSRGFVYVRNSSIAFADQEPWVQNGTVKDAIYGVSPIPPDAGWYDEVVACCGLTEDLQAFPRGDLTKIGSKGISLSGGQKQRLALARAVFSRSEILLLDDVFSGLDNDTEELIFRKLFAKDGPLRRLNRTVVLVTHAVRRLPYADMIVSLEVSGRISEMGSYETLANSNGYVRTLDVAFKQQQDVVEIEEAKPRPAAKLEETPEEGTEDLLRRTGEWKTWQHWFKSCGYVSSILGFTWGFMWTFAIQTPGVLIRIFAQNNALRSDGSATTFIAVFGITSATAALMVLALCYQILLDMQPRSAKAYHIDLLTTVLNAPLSFFTRTDIGSVTNRFSQDLSLVDSDLPFSFADFVLSFVSVVTGIGLMVASGSGYFAGTIPVMLGVMYVLQKYYLRTSRQIRLLDIEEKAPLYTLFGETASGLATVRAFGWTEAFKERNLMLLDRSQRPFYLLLSIQRWLSLVLSFIVAGLVGVLMVIVVANRRNIDPGLVGVGLLSAVTLSSSLTSVVMTWTNLETAIGAVSRIRDFVRTTTSEHLSDEQDEPRTTWPESGEVTFENFSASYSAGSPLVLDKIDLALRPAEKVGICGRSGSGKSSALASLFHLLEFQRGAITIDGIDVAHIPRETLRGRLNVIPQEPWWITTESVRFNMDPWRHATAAAASSPDTDAAYISALSRCQVWHAVAAKGGLDATMTPDFLSHGQRQLFCLARALLRQSSVVVLDEVSANVDIRTDELMQGIIRERFAGCTVVAVAHRLNTIEDANRVVVLGKGRIVEVGEPKTLLGRQGSRFRELHEI